MEVDGGLLEGTLHFEMQIQGRLDHYSNHLLHRGLILAEMLVEEGREDRGEGARLRELDSAEEEMALETRVHNKRTSSGIH